MKRYIKASESPEYRDLWRFLYEKTSKGNYRTGRFDFNIKEYTNTYCEVSLNHANTARARSFASWIKAYFKDRIVGEVELRLYNKVATVSVNLRPIE